MPASITVVSREEIQREQVTTPHIEDLLSRKVPGFNPTNNGVGKVRGRTAQVFVNGVPVNEQLRAGSSGSDINFLIPDQLASIEVRRGANSAYGFGSPGGIIALTTPRAESRTLTFDGLGVFRQIQSSIGRFPPGDDGFRRSYTANLTYENPNLGNSSVKLELLASRIRTDAFRTVSGRTVGDEQANEYRGFRSSVTTPFDGLYRGLSATYGFDYLRNRYFRLVFFTDTGELQTFISPDVSLDSYAPHVQIELLIGDFRMSGGVRHEEYRGHVETAVGSGGVQGGDIRPFDLTLFNAGVLYALNETVDLFATFSQGAEISQLGRAARGAGTAERINPGPAKSNQYEVGVRRAGPALDDSASAFFTESDLLSFLQPDPNDPLGPLIPLREPRRFWGAEANLNGRMTRQWAIGGVLTWYEGIRETETSEKRHIGSRDVPPPLVSGYIDYAPCAWWRNTLQIDYRTERDPFGDNTAFGEGRVDSVLLVHLPAGFDVGPGELRVGVRNLFNKTDFSIPAEAGNSGFLWIPEEGTRLTASYWARW